MQMHHALVCNISTVLLYITWLWQCCLCWITGSMARLCWSEP